MFISKENFTNENGVEMVRECYGPDEDTVTATIVYSKPAEGVELPGGQGPEPEATQLDRIEAQTAYIAMMMDGGEA